MVEAEDPLSRSVIAAYDIPQALSHCQNFGVIRSKYLIAPGCTYVSIILIWAMSDHINSLAFQVNGFVSTSEKRDSHQGLLAANFDPGTMLRVLTQRCLVVR